MNGQLKRGNEEGKMVKKVTLIEVFFGHKRVGRLAEAPDRRFLFEYDPQWIDKGFSISPFYLPLKNGVFSARMEPFDGLFGVFDDSLPDGWGKLLVDRLLARNGINPKGLSALDRLSLVGENGMGALLFRPDQSQKANNQNLPLDFYADEIEKILKNEYTSSLDELVERAGSSGGARPKVMITIEGEEWLIKFRSSIDPLNVGKTEYHHSLLAKKCGIEMPETRLFEGKYFGVRRFDRERGERYHVHSAAGLLNASYRLPSLDYISLLKATLLLTKDITEMGKMFRLMVFNVLIGNKDDHAKNFSFIYRNNRWQLSPAYDLLPSYGFNDNHTTTVNGKGRPTLNDCLEVSAMTSFPVKTAKNIIDEVQQVCSDDKMNV